MLSTPFQVNREANDPTMEHPSGSEPIDRSQTDSTLPESQQELPIPRWKKPSGPLSSQILTEDYQTKNKSFRNFKVPDWGRGRRTQVDTVSSCTDYQAGDMVWLPPWEIGTEPVPCSIHECTSQHKLARTGFNHLSLILCKHQQP